MARNEGSKPASSRLATAATVAAVGFTGLALGACEDAQDVGKAIDKGTNKADKALDDVGRKVKDAAKDSK